MLQCNKTAMGAAQWHWEKDVNTVWRTARAWGAAAPRWGLVVWQVLLLSAIWAAAQWLCSRWDLPLPAGLLGCALLALGLFSKLVPVRWLAAGTRWLLADMLLFFIPAMLVVLNYADLVRSQGLRIVAVIVLSTACVMAVTAWVVDKVYRLELLLARRQRQQHKSASRKGQPC